MGQERKRVRVELNHFYITRVLVDLTVDGPGPQYFLLFVVDGTDLVESELLVVPWHFEKIELLVSP